MLCLATAILMSLASQDEDQARARERAIDARLHCVLLLDALPGVTSVNYAGSGTDYRLMIVVRDRETRVAAREKLGGESIDGVRILWSQSAPSVSPEIVSISAPAAAGTTLVASAAPPPPAAPEPECDIIRARYGLKPLRRAVGGSSWKSWVPCQVWLRAVEGGGGGHSYLYTKHRPGCPFDDSLISPVVREGFLHPWGLRASDSNWWAQVGQDLQYRFQPRPAMPLKPDPPRPEVHTR